MKKVSLRIRKQYFDEIVAGKKTFELRKPTNYWHRRLIINRPEIAVFVCGKKVHRRYILRVFEGWTESILGRALSEQGLKDVGHSCIAIQLGDVVMESDDVSGGGTEQ